MTKSELIDSLFHKHSQLQKADVETAVNTILSGLSNALANGDRAELRGFGTFELNHRPPRKGRNPKTGESVAVPAKAVPHFKAGRELRERVDYKKA